MNDELRSEYDLTELLQGGERGKYAARYRQGTNLILLAPELVMQLAQIPRRYRHSVAEK